MSKEFETISFDHEVILPAQVSWGARCDANTSGACALMLAILEDAILCIERGRRRRHAGTRAQAAEAEMWMRSEGREWLFSFASICDVLGFDADVLRARLLTNAELRGSGAAAPYAEANQVDPPRAAHLHGNASSLSFAACC